jgi:hypothetical protein
MPTKHLHVVFYATTHLIGSRTFGLICAIRGSF